MNKRHSWILALFSLLLIPIGFFTIRTLEWFIPSFPELFFGQLRLTRDSAGLSPRAYQSAEFVLGMVDESEIRKASYIHIQDDVFFWDPYYPGFPRTELSLEEIRQIQEVLAAGKMVKQNYPEDDWSCLEVPQGAEPEWQSCPEGGEYWDQFNDYRFEASRTREVGLLLFELSGGRIAEIRISPGENGLAFEPTEKSGPWWIDGVINQPFPLLEELAARAEVQPIEVLWPGLNASQANTKAERILGKRYRRALETVMVTPKVKEAFGEIEQIRPALGNNSYSSWMDSTSITLTFYVAGPKNKGVVLARGLDCFELRMVVGGVPVRDTIDYVCP